MTDTSLLFNVIAKDKTGPGLSAAEKGFERLGESVHKLGERMVEAFALEKLFEFGKGSVEIAEKAEKAEKLTEAAIKSTGGAAQLTAEQVGELSTKLSDHNGVTESAVHAAENLLLTFTNVRDAGGKTGGTFDQASQSIIDMTAAMNQGVVSADNIKTTSLQVGKALNDPIKGITALRRVGVAFSDSQQKTIKTMVATGHGAKAQQVILAELKKEFGGAAAAMATPMDRAKVAVEKTRREIGEGLLPVVGRAADWISTKATPAIQHLVEEVRHGEGGWATTRERVAQVASGLGTLVSVLGKSAGFLYEHRSALEAILIPLAAVAVGFAVFSVATAVVGGLAAILPALVTGFWALDAAMDANPIGLVVAGVAALGAGLYLAWKHSEMFRKVVSTAFNAVSTVVFTEIKAMTNIVLGFWEGIIKGAAKAFGWVPGLGGKLKKAGDAIGDFRARTNSELDAIRDRLHVTITADAHQAFATIEAYRQSLAAIGVNTGKQATPTGFSIAIDQGIAPPKFDAAPGEGFETAIESTSGGGQEFSGGGGGGSKAKAVKKKAQNYGKLIGIAIAKGLTGSATAIASAFDRITQALTDGGRSAAAKVAKTEESAMLALAKKRDAIETKLKADRLGKIKKDAADYAKAIKDGYVEAANITSLEHIGGNGAQQIGDLRGLLDRAQSFTEVVGRLRKMGLNKTALAQIIAAGPEGGGLAAATQLVNGGSVGTVNSLMGQIAAAGGSLGASESKVKYAQQEKDAAKERRDLVKSEAALVKQMRNLAVKVELNVAGGDKELVALIRKIVRLNGGTAQKAFG